MVGGTSSRPFLGSTGVLVGVDMQQETCPCDRRYAIPPPFSGRRDGWLVSTCNRRPSPFIQGTPSRPLFRVDGWCRLATRLLIVIQFAYRDAIPPSSTCLWIRLVVSWWRGGIPPSSMRLQIRWRWRDGMPPRQCVLRSERDGIPPSSMHPRIDGLLVGGGTASRLGQCVFGSDVVG